MTIGALRRVITAQFKQAGLDSPALDAKLLILNAAGLSEIDLILGADDALEPAQVEDIEALSQRRLSGEPIDHILGYRDFYGRRFKVSKDVLSPRQETEALVTRALCLCADVMAPHILDLGTGSGAIIISLLSERDDAEGLAVDVSEAALSIAKDNASSVGVQERLTFACGSWFKPVRGQFDVIVSNPPYITDAAMTTLPREVSGFDPDISLRGGADGLAAYRVIAGGALAYLKPGGWLVFEIGYDQGASVSQILRQNRLTSIKVERDLSGHNRIVYGQKPLENNSA